MTGNSIIYTHTFNSNCLL